MATRYWVGTSAANRSGSWTTSTAQWSNSAGGANGAPVPTATDDAVFPEYGATYTANISLNSVLVSSLTITGNNIVFTGSFSIIAYGNVAINGGGFTSPSWSATIAMRPNATLGNTTLYSNGAQIRPNLEINAASGYSVTLNSNVTLSGSGQSVLNLISGNLNLNGYNMTSAGLSANGIIQRGLNFQNGYININNNLTGITAPTISNLTTDKLGYVIDSNCGTKSYGWGNVAGGSTSNWIKLYLTGTSTPAVNGNYELLNVSGLSTFISGSPSLTLGSFVSYSGGAVNQTATGTWNFIQNNGTITLNGGRLGITTFNPGAGNTITLNDAFLGNTINLLTGNLNCNSFNFGSNTINWGNTANAQPGTLINNVGTLTCTNFSVVGNINPLTINFPLVATTSLSVNGGVTVNLPSSGTLTTPSLSMFSGVATRALVNVQANTTIYNNVALGTASNLTMSGNSNVNLNGYTFAVGTCNNITTSTGAINFGNAGRMILQHSTANLVCLNLAYMTNFTTTGTNAFGFQTAMDVTRSINLGNSASAGNTANGSINLYVTSGGQLLTLVGGNAYFKTLDLGASTTNLAGNIYVNNLTLGAASVSSLLVNIGNYEAIGLTTGTLSSPYGATSNALIMNPGANTTITLGTGGYRTSINVQMQSGTLNLNGNTCNTVIFNYTGGNVTGNGTIDTTSAFYNNGASWTCNATLNSKGSNTANTGFILNSGDITFGTNGGFGPNIGNLITHNAGNLTINNGIGLATSQNSNYILNSGNINLNNLYLQVGKFQSFNSNVRNIAFGTTGEIQITGNVNSNANANTIQLYVQTDNMTVSGSKTIRLNSQLSNGNLTANFYWQSTNGSGPNATTGFYAQSDIDKAANLIVTDTGGGAKYISGVYNTVDLQYSSVSSIRASNLTLGFACSNLILPNNNSTTLSNISFVTGGYISNPYNKRMGSINILHTPNNQTTTLLSNITIGQSIGSTYRINVQKGTFDTNNYIVSSVCANVDPVAGVSYDKSIIFYENKPWYLTSYGGNGFTLYFPDMTGLSMTKAANSGFVVAPYLDLITSNPITWTGGNVLIASGFNGGANVNNAPDLTVLSSNAANAVTTGNLVFYSTTSNGSWYGNLNLSNTTVNNVSVALASSSAQVVNATNLYLGNTTTYSTQLNMKMYTPASGGSTTIAGNEQTIASLELNAYEPTLTSNLTVAGAVTLSNNALNLSTYNLTANTFSCEGSNVTRILGSGILTITGASFTVNNLNFNSGYAGPHTYTIKMASATNKTFIAYTGLGGTGYGTLIQAGAGTLLIDGSNSTTFVDIQSNTYPSVIEFGSSQFGGGLTLNLANFTLSGTDGNLVTITSTSGGSPFTLSKSSGIVNAQYLSISNSTATGGATWNANYSTNAGNNSGWVFGNTPAVTYKGNFFVFL